MRTASQRPSLKRKFVLPSDADYACVPEGLTEASHQRIASVIPLVVHKINLFVASLRPRELAQFDVKDLIQELWVSLLEKDRYFDPGRGIKYTTWMEKVVKQQLGVLRNRCHIVESPRDTSARLKNPDAVNPKLLASIRHAISDVSSLTEEAHDPESRTEDRDEVSFDKERSAAAVKLIKTKLSSLESFQIQLLVWKWGLLDQAPKTMTEIAQIVGPPMTSSHAGRLAQMAEMALLNEIERDDLAYTSAELALA